MLPKKYLGLALLATMPLFSCSSEPDATAEPFDVRSTDMTLESRGVAIPATFVTPVGRDGVRYPLVVMAHGHGGSRQEGGGYQQVAERMAERGIASIRMDFPGCGDSTESFTENNLSNMLLDLQAGREYAVSQAEVDANRVGLLGYSMGGRLVALLAEQDPSYKVMVMWTPALADGAQREQYSVGGSAENYFRLKELARTTGMAEYTTQWGAKLQLGYRWFTDIEDTMPLASLASFEGPLLILYGDQDDVVPPAISDAAVAAASSSREVVRHVVPGATHALGFYDNRPEMAADVVETTAAFLSERL